jgi:hypothetical protein
MNYKKQYIALHKNIHKRWSRKVEICRKSKNCKKEGQRSTSTAHEHDKKFQLQDYP